MPDADLNVSKEQIEALEGEFRLTLYHKVWIIILIIYFLSMFCGMGYVAYDYGTTLVDNIKYDMEQSKARAEKEKNKKKKGKR
jgi:hypothetical protein|tara:strand:+ start:436 stop:684 length:249 start_codon:yes stop_codon:yes gene_type:complete